MSFIKTRKNKEVFFRITLYTLALFNLDYVIKNFSTGLHSTGDVSRGAAWLSWVYSLGLNPLSNLAPVTGYPFSDNFFSINLISQSLVLLLLFMFSQFLDPIQSINLFIITNYLFLVFILNLLSKHLFNFFIPRLFFVSSIMFSTFINVKMVDHIAYGLIWLIFLNILFLIKSTKFTHYVYYCVAVLILSAISDIYILIMVIITNLSFFFAIVFMNKFRLLANQKITFENILFAVLNMTIVCSLSILTKYTTHIERSLQDFTNFSSRWWHWLIPPPSQIYSKNLRNIFENKVSNNLSNLAESTNYFGIFSIILLIFLIFGCRKMLIFRDVNNSVQSIFFIFGIILSFSFSLQPIFQLFDKLDLYSPSFFFYYFITPLRSVNRFSFLAFSFFILFISFLLNQFISRSKVVNRLSIFIYLLVFICLSDFLLVNIKNQYFWHKKDFLLSTKAVGVEQKTALFLPINIPDKNYNGLYQDIQWVNNLILVNSRDTNAINRMRDLEDPFHPKFLPLINLISPDFVIIDNNYISRFKSNSEFYNILNLENQSIDGYSLFSLNSNSKNYSNFYVDYRNGFSISKFENDTKYVNLIKKSAKICFITSNQMQNGFVTIRFLSNVSNYTLTFNSFNEMHKLSLNKGETYSLTFPKIQNTACVNLDLMENFPSAVQDLIPYVTFFD